MSKMAQSLEDGLDAHKHELLWSAKSLLDEYWMNRTPDHSDGFIATISSSGDIPYRWKRLRRVLEKILGKEIKNVG